MLPDLPHTDVATVCAHEHSAKIQGKTNSEDNIPRRLIRGLDIERDHEPGKGNHDGRYDSCDRKHAIGYAREIVLKGAVSGFQSNI